MGDNRRLVGGFVQMTNGGICIIREVAFYPARGKFLALVEAQDSTLRKVDLEGLQLVGHEEDNRG